MARVKRLSKVKCTCVLCGKSFKALRSDAKYCKNPCTAYDAKKAEIALSATIVPDGHIFEFNASEPRGIAGADFENRATVGQLKIPVKRVKRPVVRGQYYDENKKPKAWPLKASWPKETITIYQGEEMYKLDRNSKLAHPLTYKGTAPPATPKQSTKKKAQNKHLATVYADPKIRAGVNCVGDKLVGDRGMPCYMDRHGFLHRTRVGERQLVDEHLEPMDDSLYCWPRTEENSPYEQTPFGFGINKEPESGWHNWRGVDNPYGYEEALAA